VKVHLEPITFLARLYSGGRGYGDEYDAVFTVQRTGSIGYVSGCHGTVDMTALRDLFKQLKAQGITEVHWLSGDGSQTTKVLS
jgi:hypothetical protein